MIYIGPDAIEGSILPKAAHQITAGMATNPGKRHSTHDMIEFLDNASPKAGLVEAQGTMSKLRKSAGQRLPHLVVARYFHGNTDEGYWVEPWDKSADSPPESLVVEIDKPEFWPNTSSIDPEPRPLLDSVGNKITVSRDRLVIDGKQLPLLPIDVLVAHTLSDHGGMAPFDLVLESVRGLSERITPAGLHEVAQSMAAMLLPHVSQITWHNTGEGQDRIIGMSAIPTAEKLKLRQPGPGEEEWRDVMTVGARRIDTSLFEKQVREPLRIILSHLNTWYTKKEGEMLFNRVSPVSQRRYFVEMLRLIDTEGRAEAILQPLVERGPGGKNRDIRFRTPEGWDNMEDPPITIRHQQSQPVPQTARPATIESAADRLARRRRNRKK